MDGRTSSRLKGMCAIVTGAGRGIGRSISLALAREGAHLILAARTEGELDVVRQEIEDGGGRTVMFPADLSREPEAVALVKFAIDYAGRLDILVNNAGLGIFGPLVDCATEDWDQIMAVNARGPYVLCREAIPHLRLREISYIVNVGSVVSEKGYQDQAAYSASKHALLGMSKAMAKEVQDENIRVHAVCPGGVATDLVARARPDLDAALLMEPEEIADIVLFLVTRRGNAVIDEIFVRRSASTPWA